MKNIHFTEISYLIGCVFLGGLSYSYAKNIRNYVQDKDKIIKPDGSAYNFNELIGEMYSYFRIMNADANFIKYRDEILTQGGISSIRFDELLQEKIKLETLIEHLLLNISNCNSLYWDRSSKEWIEYKPRISE
jgi:hypothetical protein